MTAQAPPADRGSTDVARSERGTTRIGEIDGLRGIALTLVVVFHLFGHGRVSGGVDVFLMISGFLLTLSLGRALTAGRPLHVLGRWARTFLRLAPPTALVLLAIVALSFLVFDPREQLDTLRETVSAALYMENWYLIDESLSYDAAGSGTSPLQHFWSLSVQAQFFLAFPLVALAIVAAVRSRRWRARVFWAVVVGGTIVSFVYAARANAADATTAYFHTFARLWELGAGGIVAGLWMRGFAVPAAWRGIVGWIGIAAIIACGFLIDGAAAYPGPLALVPTMGAALVLLSSGAAHRFSASSFLTRRPLIYLDRISYGLYLWHWPILIAYLTYRGRDDGAIGPLGAVGVLTAAYVATVVTTWLLRRPVRWGERRGTRSAVVIVAVALVVGVVPASASAALIERSGDAPLTECSGAAALDPEKSDCPDFTEHASWMPPAGIVPAEAVRGEDSANRGECWSSQALDEFNMCALGDTDSERRLLAIGDSHLAHYIDAVDEIGQEQGWRIDLAARGHCRWTGIDAQVKRIDEVLRERCRHWKERANDVVEAGGYDAIIVASGSHSRLDAPEGESVNEYEADQLIEAWSRRPNPAEVQIIALRDNPRVLSSRQEACLGDAEALVAGTCAAPRTEAIADTGLDDAVARDPNATVIDLNDYICGPDTCNPVVGGVYVYRDNAHMTGQFISTLQPYLEEELVEALGSGAR